jgi:ribosomal protein L11 methyltransferase
LGYYELRIAVPEESRDALIFGLSEIGCLGIIEREKELIAYFRDTIGIDSIQKGIESFRTILAKSGLPADFKYNHVYISEKDWNEAWKKKLQPIDVGEQFFILPPWEKKRPDRMSLVIDPGTAFGTGHHQTTQTCLLLIGKYSRRCPRDRFLDVGTGTGVLAICASKLGFKEAVGVDIDPLAVAAAARNARHNHLENIVVKEGDITTAEGKFDFIAANLLSEIILSIAPKIAGRLREHGIVLLSGMISGQEDEIVAQMKEFGLECIEKFTDGIWVSVVLQDKR